MLIIGVDFHSRFQQIAMVDTETGEFVERRLEHENGEAERFYAGLGKPVRVGMEATGYAQWFERMLAQLGHELWIGDAAEIRAAMVRKQKTDARDARHILDLLLANRFPRIWIPSPAERDLRQLLRHRHKMVWPTNFGEKPVACAGHGRGRLPEKEIVGRWRTDRTGSSGVGSMGESPTPGTAGNTRPAGSFAGGVGSSSSERSRALPGRPLLNGTSRGGAGHSLAGHHLSMQRLFAHRAGIFVIGEDLPDQRNRVDLDPVEKDSDGISAARVTYNYSENSVKMLDHEAARARQVLDAAGAIGVQDNGSFSWASHLMGTARMGTDPRRSVVNAWNQSHDIKNLFIVDGSSFTTGAGVNPTSTIGALALRCADGIWQRRHEFT